MPLYEICHADGRKSRRINQENDTSILSNREGERGTNLENLSTELIHIIVKFLRPNNPWRNWAMPQNPPSNDDLCRQGLLGLSTAGRRMRAIALPTLLEQITIDGIYSRNFSATSQVASMQHMLNHPNIFIHVRHLHLYLGLQDRTLGYLGRDKEPHVLSVPSLVLRLLKQMGSNLETLGLRFDSWPDPNRIFERGLNESDLLFSNVKRLFVGYPRLPLLAPKCPNLESLEEISGAYEKNLSKIVRAARNCRNLTRLSLHRSGNTRFTFRLFTTVPILRVLPHLEELRIISPWEYVYHEHIFNNIICDFTAHLAWHNWGEGEMNEAIVMYAETTFAQLPKLKRLYFADSLKCSSPVLMTPEWVMEKQVRAGLPCEERGEKESRQPDNWSAASLQVRPESVWEDPYEIPYSVPTPSTSSEASVDAASLQVEPERSVSVSTPSDFGEGSD